jgi:RND superfamily putative drug exporter
VFGAFVLNPTPEVKMFGLGLAVAVLVDATIVRMMLVPATMEILGDANWWFPKWLSFLPTLDLEGTSATDPTEPTDPTDPAGDLVGAGV